MLEHVKVTLLREAAGTLLERTCDEVLEMIFSVYSKVRDLWLIKTKDDPSWLEGLKVSWKIAKVTYFEAAFANLLVSLASNPLELRKNMKEKIDEFKQTEPKFDIKSIHPALMALCGPSMNALGDASV